MTKLINLSVVTAYLYILTVLSYYGYNSYFSIPYYSAGFSPQAPVIFFFDFSRLILDLLKHATISFWITIIVSIIVVIGIYSYHALGRWLVNFGLIIALVYTFFGFYNFGHLLASSATNFYTADLKCIPGATEKLYIAPALSEGKVFFVPIDPGTHQLKNGLLVRESTNITCQLEKKEIGKITK